MAYFRIFSAVSPDVGSDYYDDTSLNKILSDGIERLVLMGSEWSVWVYSSRRAFLNGADPYAVLTSTGDGVVTVSDTINGWSDRRSVRMHVSPVTPSNVAGRVDARVRTLAKRYAAVYRLGGGNPIGGAPPPLRMTQRR